MSYKVKYHICHRKYEKILMDVAYSRYSDVDNLGRVSFVIFRNKNIFRGCHANSDPENSDLIRPQTPKIQTPRIYFKKIYIVKSSQFLSPNVLWSRNVCSVATARYLSSPVYRCRVNQAAKWWDWDEFQSFCLFISRCLSFRGLLKFSGSEFSCHPMADHENSDPWK